MLPKPFSRERFRPSYGDSDLVTLDAMETRETITLDRGNEPDARDRPSRERHSGWRPHPGLSDSSVGQRQLLVSEVVSWHPVGRERRAQPGEVVDGQVEIGDAEAANENRLAEMQAEPAVGAPAK